MSVPLSTIKNALKIDYSDDDSELIRLREAAASLIQRETQLVITLSSQTMYLAAFTDVTFPLHPFNSVSSIQYYTAGDITTLSGTNWYIDRTDALPVLRFIDPPSFDENTAITVTYNAGYSELPGEITHCIIALVGAWYSNPEAIQPIGMSEVPMSVRWILDGLSVRSKMR